MGKNLVADGILTVGWTPKVIHANYALYHRNT